MVIMIGVLLYYINLNLQSVSLQYLSLYFGYRKLRLEPEGFGTEVDTFISLYLKLDDSESLPPKRKLYAKYKLRIRNQILNNHLEETGMFS
jgi:hypothetical protein